MMACKVSAVVPVRLAEVWIADGLRGTVVALLLPLDLLLAGRSAVQARLALLQWAAWWLAWHLCAPAAAVRSSLGAICALAVGVLAAVGSGRRQRLLAGVRRRSFLRGGISTALQGCACFAPGGSSDWRTSRRGWPVHGCLRTKEEY